MSCVLPGPLPNSTILAQWAETTPSTSREEAWHHRERRARQEDRIILALASGRCRDKKHTAGRQDRIQKRIALATTRLQHHHGSEVLLPMGWAGQAGKGAGYKGKGKGKGMPPAQQPVGTGYAPWAPFHSSQPSAWGYYGDAQGSPTRNNAERERLKKEAIDKAEKAAAAKTIKTLTDRLNALEGKPVTQTTVLPTVAAQPVPTMLNKLGRTVAIEWNCTKCHQPHHNAGFLK